MSENDPRMNSIRLTRSDFTLAMARSFSSAVSHRAVAGRSVKVKKAMRERPMVIMPSIAKIILQLVRLPTLSSVRIAEARRPPKAPAKGAMTMYNDKRKANSLLRYHRER